MIGIDRDPYTHFDIQAVILQIERRFERQVGFFSPTLPASASSVSNSTQANSSPAQTGHGIALLDALLQQRL